MQDKNFGNLSNDAQNSRALDENLKNLTAAEKLSAAVKKDKTPREKTGKKWKKLAGICVVFLAILVLISAGVFAILLASGKMYAGFFKNSGETVAFQAHVCDGEIEEFNNLNDTAKNQADYINGLKNITAKISAKSDNGKDINCQYILWYEANIAKDTAKMQSVLAKIEELSETQFFSNRFDRLTTIPTMKLYTGSSNA